MSSMTGDEARIESDCHKRDKINGHRSSKSLVKRDSQFKITMPNCNVLQHLVRSAAMVAVPSILTQDEDKERKDNIPHVAIVTADKEEALWWHMDKLKTSAPDMCAKEAMFKMTIEPNPKDGGSSVMFRSYLMDQYLIVVEDEDVNKDQPDHGQSTQPQFKFKLSSSPDKGVTSTFILGTTTEDDDPNYRFLRFWNAKDNQWYYWYEDGDGEVKLRNEPDSTETEKFSAVIVRDCGGSAEKNHSVEPIAI